MLKYVPIYTGIWADKRFKSLSPQARLLFIFLFSNESVTLTGIYEVDIEVMEIRLKLTKTFVDVFDEVINSGMIKFDEEKNIVWVVNRFKFIPNLNIKTITGAIHELNKIKHKFKDEFIVMYENILKPYKAALNGFDVDTERMLDYESVQNWSKLYKTTKDLRGFLVRRTNNPQRVDEVLKQYGRNVDGL